MNEVEFWESTPKKICTLWKLHAKFNGWEINSGSNNEKQVFIDQVPFL